MPLTTTQLQALKTAIAANPTWAAIPNNSDGNFTLAALLNAPAAPSFPVWRTDTKASAILDAIDFSKYTPNDAADSTTLWLNRALAAQTKQLNLQIMVQGRDTLNTAPPNVRAGLRDAVIAVPTGAAGALTSPGGASGVNVLNACTRNATEAEKILATASQASDTTGAVTARVMGYEGAVSAQDVETARNLP